jgi:hypothetical protein
MRRLRGGTSPLEFPALQISISPPRLLDAASQQLHSQIDYEVPIVLRAMIKSFEFCLPASATCEACEMTPLAVGLLDWAAEWSSEKSKHRSATFDLDQPC